MEGVVIYCVLKINENMYDKMLAATRQMAVGLGRRTDEEERARMGAISPKVKIGQTEIDVAWSDFVTEPGIALADLEAKAEKKAKKAWRKKTILWATCAALAVTTGAAGITWGVMRGGVRRVDETSDVLPERQETAKMLPAASLSRANLTQAQEDYVTSVQIRSSVDARPVAEGELWREESITIYETADFDLCAGGGLTNLGEMYWQTSNPEVISGFFSGARTWLGYSSEICRTPIIAGTGRTVITAGTYDGTRRDAIEVNVVAAPKEQWKYEVLTLVNQERVRNGLGLLSWGETCADAAEIRAKELASLYAHTRPDGSSWNTACLEPDDEAHIEGENLVAGNAAVSPEAVVAAWMNSEKHRENILNPAYTKLAVGFYIDQESQYKTYWSQYFSDF